jgi:AraC-like DNA-binding protein
MGGDRGVGVLGVHRALGVVQFRDVAVAEVDTAEVDRCGDPRGCCWWFIPPRYAAAVERRISDSSYSFRDRSRMPSDPLSEVFDLIAIQGLMSGSGAAHGAWVARGKLTESLKFIAVARGQARVTSTDTTERLVLEPGDVAVLNNQTWLEVRGGPEGQVAHEIDVTNAIRPPVDTEGADVILGGHIALNAIGKTLLQQALPPVGHLQAAATTAPLRSRIEQLLDEMSGDRPWRLDSLAQAAAMSRTAFATRFRDVAGMPPLAYLNQWRMLLAQRALRAGDDPIRTLASTLGYGSESAFSTAFKRQTGEPPLRYRRRVREEAAR